MHFEHILILIVILWLSYLLIKASSKIFVKIISTFLISSIFFAIITVTFDGIATVDHLFEFYKVHIIAPVAELISSYVSLEYIKDIDISKIKDYFLNLLSPSP